MTYQIVHQIFLDGRYQLTRVSNVGLNTETTDHDFGVDVRFDF